MADLDTLRPEVQKALDDLNYFLTGTHNHVDFYTIRAELLRLGKIEAERWSVVATRNAAVERAEKAESGLAALKARIAKFSVEWRDDDKWHVSDRTRLAVEG